MTERRLTVTINGPEGMLEAMAGMLRSEGYLVTSPATLDAETAHSREFWRAVERETMIPLVTRSIALWHEWSTTDITATDDGWAEFSDRAHAWLDDARKAVPGPPGPSRRKRAGKAAKKARRRAKP